MKFKVRDITEGDRALAAKWIARMPDSLFKYRGLVGVGRERLEALVRGSTLHFPTYAELNDPFDSNFSFDFAATPEVLEAYWRHALPDGLTDRDAMVKAAVAESSKTIARGGIVGPQEMMSRYGVCCLTAAPDNILMWSYYADGHAGVCLRFRSDGLFDSYCRDGKGVLVPVEYAAEYPVVPYFDSGVITLVHGGIGTKAMGWGHEAEWRIVHPSLSGPAPFLRSALDGIILGARISVDDEKFVRELAGRADVAVPVLRAVKMEREYGVRIEGA